MEDLTRTRGGKYASIYEDVGQEDESKYEDDPEIQYAEHYPDSNID